MELEVAYLGSTGRTACSAVARAPRHCQRVVSCHEAHPVVVVLATVALVLVLGYRELRRAPSMTALRRFVQSDLIELRSVRQPTISALPSHECRRGGVDARDIVDGCVILGESGAVA